MHFHNVLEELRVETKNQLDFWDDQLIIDLNTELSVATGSIILNWLWLRFSLFECFLLW